jgi:hypothetical protein
MQQLPILFLQIFKHHRGGFLELQIMTLQNASRDPDKLERLLKAKGRHKERNDAHGRYRKIGNRNRTGISGTVFGEQRKKSRRQRR